MTHHLKITPELYLLVLQGIKTCEIRIDDRPFNVGDWLALEGYKNGAYDGTQLLKKVTHTLRDCPEYGIKEGFVLMSLRR